MLAAVKYFYSVMDEANWKQCFLYNRSCSIVLVRCESQQINDFWRYACYNHIICTSIDDALHKIIPDEARVIYYKMFIKCGEYENDYRNISVYNHRNCGIEMIGDSKTIIIDKYNQFEKHMIYSSAYFSAYNITFRGGRLEIYDTDNVHINNCIFDQSKLILYNVQNAIIANCNFDINYPLYVKLHDTLMKMNYTIENNIFISTADYSECCACIIFDDKPDLALMGICNSSSIINIVNNIITRISIVDQN